MIKAWSSSKQPLIFTNNFKKIQNIIDVTPLSSDIDHIPYKIAFQFAGFSADQWKSWCLIYSILALRDILSEEHQ